ncbi:hypothetical protein SprV_0100402000 [Sparganum proliferum]
MMRAKLHPCRLPPHRKTEGVDQEKTVLRTGLQEEVITVAAVDPMVTKHPLSGSVVWADAVIEVTKDYQLACLLHSRQKGVQVSVVLSVIGLGHCWGTGTDGGDDFFPAEWQPHDHETVIEFLWQAGQTFYVVVPSCECYAGFSSLCPFRPPL